MARRRVLVEGFEPDALALARHLAATGDDVRLAGPGDAPAEAVALRALGIRVEPHTDLDADTAPGSPTAVPTAAYLDVWTPEIAPRVTHLRSRGAVVTCLADLILHDAPVPTLGVTGTAGKSTTTAFAVQLLRHAGLTVAASTTGRAGNLWPTEEHVPLLSPSAQLPDVIALELTSSHLAFCHSSPTVAVVTGFAPDHVELHGSVAAYRAAKERIVLAQTASDCVVVNEDDAVARAFAELTPALRYGFSLEREVGRGAFLVAGEVIARTDTLEIALGSAPEPLGGRDRATAAAVAVALACGVEPAALAGALEQLEGLPFRARVVMTVGGRRLIDDGMAATPGKGAATLSSLSPGTFVAVVGGELELAGRRVHAAAEEEVVLADALALVAGAAVRVVVFGPAGASIAPRLAELGANVSQTADLGDAIERAVALADSAYDVVVCPMFPLLLADRRSVAHHLRASL